MDEKGFAFAGVGVSAAVGGAEVVHGRGGGGGGGGDKCGRWSPTEEQVKVLTDLFRSGLRTPTTDQIQLISSHLSSFGKIESKNVFYWFQNHKARERHTHKKRRRQAPSPSPPPPTAPPPLEDVREQFYFHADNSSSSCCSLTAAAAITARTTTAHGSATADHYGDQEREIETLELFPLMSSCDEPLTLRRARGTTNWTDAALFLSGKEMMLDLRLSSL